jgi:predicted nuclease of predicted toxin-antitoxin system
MNAFLANENISRASVVILRRAGHDVVWVAESFPSIKDEKVLALAKISNRIIVTFDSDYGDLIFNKGLSPPLGVIFLRIGKNDTSLPANLILRYLDISSTIFDNRFSVVTERTIRYKLL